ncbi:MAG: 5-amino-6-(D-ribitylamino)uracil--L-tyrosine 4-hydroxyphenyl transferase CofH, partial [Microthrixaceae bacterium]
APRPARREPAAGVGGAVREVLDGVLAGERAGRAELRALFAARGPEVRAVTEVADELRRQTVGDSLTWVFNRNINYTNVCTFKCRFCGFSKGPLSLNLRGAPYLLTLDDIAERAAEAERMGATEVCLQGGIHPDFDGDYYVDVCRAVHEAAPSLHLHGFTALEVTEGARRLGEPLERYLTRLRDAGLRSLPGTAAEILDDRVRAILCPDKVDTEGWLEAHRVAHRVGLRSNVTMMFGTVESPDSWVEHLLVTRNLQDETGGFTEFVGLPFVHMAAPLYLQRRCRRGPTFREVVLVHAVARIAYHGSIDHVQASWVKLGLDGVEQLLGAGVDDLGGTLVDENISRAAGAQHGTMAQPSDFSALAERTGRSLRQRTTLYGEPPSSGAVVDGPADSPIPRAPQRPSRPRLRASPTDTCRRRGSGGPRRRRPSRRRRAPWPVGPGPVAAPAGRPSNGSRGPVRPWRQPGSEPPPLRPDPRRLHPRRRPTGPRRRPARRQRAPRSCPRTAPRPPRTSGVAPRSSGVRPRSTGTSARSDPLEASRSCHNSTGAPRPRRVPGRDRSTPRRPSDLRPRRDRHRSSRSPA